jgi:hypothetical protein
MTEPSATEHELLERTKALGAADIALAKPQAAQRSTLLTELLSEQETEAIRTEQLIHHIAGRVAA